VQKPDAIMVTVIRPPEPGTTAADLIIGSLGLAGTLLVVSLGLGAVTGAALVIWHRLRPRPWRPMPPVSPSMATADVRPSNPIQ
jgi:hypothetical protein